MTRPTIASPLTVPSQTEPDLPKSSTFFPTHAARSEGSFAASLRVTTGSLSDTIRGAFFAHSSFGAVLSTRWAPGTWMAKASFSSGSEPAGRTLERSISSRAILSFPSTRASTIRFGPSSRYASELHV
jgi:hypothetical protein